MSDADGRPVSGKVVCHFLVTLDGFVAGPNHEMDWMDGLSVRPGLIQEHVEKVGAILAGRDGWDSDIEDKRPYGGAWQGPIFILTHHPEDAEPAEGVTFLSCDVAEAARIGLEAAAGKNLEVFSPTIVRQLLERGLVDELELHIAPVLLRNGIRLFESQGGPPIRLHRQDTDDPASVVTVRYRPAWSL